MRKGLIKAIRKNLDRMAHEHPALDFSYETPETLEAEREFEDRAALYLKGQCAPVLLEMAFRDWEREMLNQPKAGMLW